MANLQESQTYEAGVYQLETTDPVVAGPEGISNLQAKQLANRTSWLKQQVDQLIADMGGLGIDDVSGLQTALNDKLGLTAKAADSELLDGKDGKIYAPPGAVISFAASSPPAGWIECNGASLSRTVYADLFAAIGTVFGAGNGSTTFNLPDLRGEFIRGFDNGRGVDSSRNIGSFQKATHIRELIDRYANYSAGTFAVGAWEIDGPRTSSVTGSKTNTTLNNNEYYVASASAQSGSGDNTGFAVRPRNIALLFCIKY